MCQQFQNHQIWQSRLIKAAQPYDSHDRLISILQEVWVRGNPATSGFMSQMRIMHLRNAQMMMLASSYDRYLSNHPSILQLLLMVS